MNRISGKYKYPTTPMANKAAIIKGDKYRFTVLTNRLIRLEYSECGKFEDRATQTVINREFDIPEFKTFERNGEIKILTDTFTLTYCKDRPFTPNSIYIKFKDNSSEWRYKTRSLDDIRENLKGTVRTLDGISGEIPLDDGLMSKNHFTELDDSKSLIIADDGWIDRRDEDCLDIYIFAYKNDYLGLLKDFYHLTGRTPLLPRFALGNMWSRFYPYTQDEYIELMDRFAYENIPFSVAVLDMDWHLVNYDPKYGRGWTGYTWNKKLFPDYKQFLKDLHSRGLDVTLNLHPADGVVPYEEMYEEMANAMGQNPEDKETVEFDITNPEFLENYFEILHHPYEHDGVSFWWMDWQQGNTSKMENIDPLWMLNHYHAIDLQNSGRRPLMLSRYSGIGSHRYPIGFSGDTIINWESLDFQPYFTASASNVGYTWWSHDIGGHMCGYRDDELAVRWCQLGVFSPINRLHSTNHPLLGKEPWNYGEVAEKSMKKFLRLRHRLIPYLYTMNYRTSEYSEPLVQPLYYKDAEFMAYEKKYRNEFYFGTEMLVLPITQSSEHSVQMSYINAYIPDGMWFDFFNGRKYVGRKQMKIYRNLYEYPVLIKAGGIIPMSELESVNDLSNPKHLRIEIYPGADNRFDLYEDDGKSLEYKDGHFAITKLIWDWQDNKKFTVSKPEGDKNVIPEDRDYTLVFNNVSGCTDVTVSGVLNDDYTVEINEREVIVTVKNAKEMFSITLNGEVKIADNDTKNDAFEFIKKFQGDNNFKKELYNLIAQNSDLSKILFFLTTREMDEDIKDVLVEIISADNEKVN